ncbi:hypothetical protein BDZ97DRAFT_1867146 [Flammula alnicola]|nr:hypothetical protein BDZ97DRAFT_1867146 [Flammula alnicola]
MQVFDAYTRVKAERDAIKKMNEDLTAAVGSSLRNAANPFAGLSGTSSPLAPMLVSNKENTLLETDHPDIRYWKKKTYIKAVGVKKDEGGILKVNDRKPLRGKTRLAETGENVAMDYIETPDGKSIDGITASSIRTYLRSLFIELNNAALKGGIPMPTSWGTSCASMRDGILLRLYAKYPYIRYCQDDWKADYLLSRSYSTWRSGEKKKADKIKVEPIKTEDVKPFDSTTSAGHAVAKREPPTFPTSNMMPLVTSLTFFHLLLPSADSAPTSDSLQRQQVLHRPVWALRLLPAPQNPLYMHEPSSGARTNSQAPTTSPTSIPVTSRPARVPAARKTRAGASRVARTAPVGDTSIDQAPADTSIDSQASTTSPTPDPAASSDETAPTTQKTRIGTEDVARTAPACMDQAPADASIDSQASATTDPAASTLAELPLTRATRSGNDIEASKAVSTAPLAADGDNTTSAAPAAASSTLAKPAVVAVPKLAPIINPL